jgi:thioredoxin-like negative regulator of GroEL
MRYWLTAIVAAALTIAGGWFVLLNQAEVFVRIAPARSVAAPLGASLLAAFLAGAAAVGLLAAGGALARAGRTWGARRRTRRDARGHATTARAQDLLWTGETSAARAALLRAQEHPASEASRLALLMETHLQEGDPGAARDVLERASPATAGDPRLLDLLARAAEELGNRPAAIDALERAYRAAPGSPRLAARLRDQYAADARWSEATALQAEVLLRVRAPTRLAAERETLVGLRYQASLDEEDPLRAARQLRGLAREAPDFVPAWVSAGERYAQAGRAAAARRAWVRGVRRRPAAVLLERIAAHDAAAGQPKRTARLLRALLRRHPGDPALALRLARHLLAHGDLDGAAAVLDGLPETADPTAQALRAELARARGDVRSAADGFARALGPDLALDEPWQCIACQACAERWDARCAACGRWDTLRGRAEAVRSHDGAVTAVTSEALIRPAN